MTKLLEQAIARARELSDEEQDALGATILALTEGAGSVLPLDDNTRAAILEGLEQARRGEFVPDAEIDALWKRHGA
jgi:predicted transcriptional regulator